MADDPYIPAPPDDDPAPGMVDPRDPAPSAPGSNESPDIDPPAWGGPEPDGDGPALIDPRPEVPGPAGL